MVNRSDGRRIAWLDAAKALGIFLVFYGHLLEGMYQYGGRPFLLPQLQFIYAYHMPLFFGLSGFLYNYKKQPFRRFFRVHFFTRLVPFFFFNLMALSALLVQQVGRGAINWQAVGRGLLALLRGTPSFNLLTWFLACLFLVELLHFGIGRWLITSKRLLAAIFLSLVFGLPIARWAAQNLAETGTYFNIWYAQEALAAYAFYLMGVWARRGLAGNVQQRTKSSMRRIGWLLLGVLFFALTSLAAPLNQGPFATEPGLVLMAVSSHGSYFWFPVTAVFGSLFLISLSKSIPVCRLGHYLGQKTLILLGMGGLFFEFFNQPMIAMSNPYFPASPFITTLQAVCLTLLSLVICVPFIWAFETYLPQLVGKPSQEGPILPPFV